MATPDDQLDMVLGDEPAEQAPTRRWLSGSLWRHPDFLKLWGAQTVSQLGSQITLLALPLTAVLILRATPAQMGLLGAVGAAPTLLLGLFVGVWVDRRRRRPILIAADLLRAALLMLIPVAALSGALRIELLYAVALLAGLGTLFFDIAYRSLLPSLVRREQLVEGNSKLEMSRSAAEIGGPGMAGALVRLAGAPVAIAADALSFLISALVLARLRVPEPVSLSYERRRIREEIGEGLRVVIGNPSLRAIAGCTGSLILFSSMMEAVFILYVARELGVGPGLIGLIFASGNVGFLVGALLAGRVTRRVGLGPALIGAPVLIGIGDLLIPLASGPFVVIVLVLAAAQFLFGLGLTIYNINQVSLRQAITEERLQGRMNATISLIAWGGAPIGALLGGAIGEAIGLRATLFVAAIGELCAILWLWFSPLRALREQPAFLDE